MKPIVQEVGAYYTNSEWLIIWPDDTVTVAITPQDVVKAVRRIDAGEDAQKRAGRHHNADLARRSARVQAANMKHAWEPHPESESYKRPFQRIRVCTNCGAEQTYHDRQLWGRVVGYTWYPKAGRCKGKRKGKRNSPPAPDPDILR